MQPSTEQQLPNIDEVRQLATDNSADQVWLKKVGARIKRAALKGCTSVKFTGIPVRVVDQLIIKLEYSGYSVQTLKNIHGYYLKVRW